MAEVTSVVRATRFELLDSEGRVRAVLGTLVADDDEVVGLVIQDRNGRDRAWIVTTGDGGAEVSLDHDGSVVVSMSVGIEGAPRVAVFDKSGVIVEAMHP